MDKEYFNLVREHCIRDGVYVKYFIAGRLQDHMSEILKKMKEDSYNYIADDWLNLKGFVTIGIECSFIKGQKEDMTSENIWESLESFRSNENKLRIQMYGPLAEKHFENETRTLFDMFDKIYKLNNLSFGGSFGDVCSNRSAIKIRHDLNPPYEVYETAHENFWSIHELKLNNPGAVPKHILQRMMQLTMIRHFLLNDTSSCDISPQDISS